MSETSDTPIGGPYFKSSIKKARERLNEQADAIVQKYLKLADMAAAAGNFDSAADILRFCIEHMADEEGQRLISESAAKPKQIADTGPKGPIIQIGVQLGGVSGPKELPVAVEVIDAEPDPR